MKRLTGAETKLEKEVQRIINRNAREYGDDPIRSWIDDLLQHGCISGMVGELIYYDDTTKFYNRHKAEIGALLSELIADTDLSVNELFGDRWEAEDPLALDTHNQNLLAWFAFEETARHLFES